MEKYFWGSQKPKYVILCVLKKLWLGFFRFNDLKQVKIWGEVCVLNILFCYKILLHIYTKKEKYPHSVHKGWKEL